MTVVIADEDKNFRTILRRFLEREKGVLIIGEAEDGNEALRLDRQLKPEIIFVALSMPKLNGLEVTRRIKATRPESRVIILAVHDEGVYRRAVMESGADGFVSKKSLPENLRFAIRNRRVSTTQPGQPLKAGHIELDPSRRIATICGKTVQLTSKEFGLLQVLIEARGGAVTHEHLFEKVWGYGKPPEPESHTVNVHIHCLRRKLGPEGRRILTVRNVGYRFDISSNWIKFVTSPTTRRLTVVVELPPIAVLAVSRTSGKPE